jgi:prepilin peptidase CpaA
MPTISLILLVSLALLLLFAAAIDIRSRIIPNWLNALVAAMAVGWWFANGLGWEAMLVQIGLAVVILLVFAGAFCLGWMGGGDVKLLAALSLWLPLEKMAGLLVWMSIGGGVLTLAMLVAHRLRHAEGRPEIPYGVAIVGAALLVLTNDILTTPVA